MIAGNYIPRGSLIVAASAPPNSRRALPGTGELFIGLILVLGAAWLADRWGLGAFFVPGQLLGYASADLAGWLQVNAWERSHDASVVYRRDGSGDVDLYACADTRSEPSTPVSA